MLESAVTLLNWHCTIILEIMFKIRTSFNYLPQRKQQHGC